MFPLLALIVGVMLSVLPAEGATITSGTGTGLQNEPPGNASVWIEGFHDPGAVDVISVCRDPAVVFAVINNDSIPPFFFQSDVFGANDGLVLRLEDPLGNGTVCRYRGDGSTINPTIPPPLTPLGVDPGFPQVELTLRRMPLQGQPNRFNFLLRYGGGTYVDGINPPPGPWHPTTPRGACPKGTLPGLVSLSMEFRLIGVPLVTVADRPDWCSSGTRNKPCDYLSFPPGPCR
jgi:hypothetical protein